MHACKRNKNKTLTMQKEKYHWYLWSKVYRSCTHNAKESIIIKAIMQVYTIGPRVWTFLFIQNINICIYLYGETKSNSSRHSGNEDQYLILTSKQQFHEYSLYMINCIMRILSKR